jgi:hypothetical protein
MATIFPFVFLRDGFREYLSFRSAVHEQGGGRRVLQKLHAAGELVVRGSLLFPNKGGTWRDFETFWNARFGGFESFLYKPQNPGAKTMGDEPPVESATQKDFAATRRYVDTATLAVRKNGVLQTLSVHYSVVNESGAAYVLGTSTKLVVRFVNAPGLGATVTLAYEFYVPVRFEGDDLPDEQEMATGGGVGTALVDRTVRVQLRETGPGFSYAAAPNSL